MERSQTTPDAAISSPSKQKTSCCQTRHLPHVEGPYACDLEAGVNNCGRLPHIELHSHASQVMTIILYTLSGYKCGRRVLWTVTVYKQSCGIVSISLNLYMMPVVAAALWAQQPRHYS
eukprot:2323853-Amphidinium_carterae.1